MQVASFANFYYFSGKTTFSISTYEPQFEAIIDYYIQEHMSNDNPVLVQPSEQWVCLRDQEQNDPDDFCPFCKATTVQKRGEQNRGRNIKQELSPWSCLSVNFEAFESVLWRFFCGGFFL